MCSLDHVLEEFLDISKGINDGFAHGIVSGIVVFHETLCNRQQAIFVARQGIDQQFRADDCLALLFLWWWRLLLMLLLLNDRGLVPTRAGSTCSGL